MKTIEIDAHPDGMTCTTCRIVVNTSLPGGKNVCPKCGQAVA